MKKLIQLSDFVLEQTTNEWSATRRLSLIIGYAEFLKQPLTMAMFVPCDEVGNVLSEKTEPNKSEYWSDNNTVFSAELYKHNLDEFRQYKKAKEKVLLEGFTYKKIPVMGDILNLKGKFICMADDLRNSKATIEDLIEDNSIYELTPSALQQIGIEE